MKVVLRTQDPSTMAVFIPFFLCLSAMLGEDSSAFTPSSDQSDPSCHECGRSVKAVRVVHGEAGWLSCPLDSHSTGNESMSLSWSRLRPEQDLEQPITDKKRVSQDKERLWLQPAHQEDTGQYICTLRNRTSCTKISMSLEVVSLSGTGCQPLVAVTPSIVRIPFQSGWTLSCPDLQDVTTMADSSPSVTWYHNCTKYPFWDLERVQEGSNLRVHQMGEMFQGQYFCQVNYTHRDHPLGYTRALNVSAVSPMGLYKKPTILIPNKGRSFAARLGLEVRLDCRAFFPFLEDSPWAVRWTVDGKELEKTDSRFSMTNQVESVEHGDRTVERFLVVKDVQKNDLTREFTCTASNSEGSSSQRAQLHQETYSPSVELGCGLGGALMLVLVLVLVYHVFWLELLLLYRSWFGTDERYTDEKEFDVYISYVRDGEEEHFAVSTLREVLENRLGYSVCIFDRDSLPGGTITDETLSFVGRSRRLLVVLSPGFASRGTQALLELKAGLDHMALGGHLRVILVQYRPLRWQAWVGELRRARVVLALLRWKGDQSKELTSTFWKRLRLELPLQKGRKDAELGPPRAYHSQSSTSSQTGLLSPGGPGVHRPQYSS